MSNHSTGVDYAIKVTLAERRRRRPRWNPPTCEEIKRMRADLGLTQEVFADKFGFDLVSLRKWEQDRATPEQVSCMVMKMIQDDHETVANLVSRAKLAEPS